MGFFSSMFGFDKIKKQADDYNARRAELRKLCGEPFVETANEVLYVDIINRRFYFDNLINEKQRASFDFSKYMGADMIVNETVINDRHTSISGAILGGLLFGTAGAIIAGSSGKITQETKIESIKLIFRFDDYDHPIIEMKQPIDKHFYVQKIWLDKIQEINEKIAKIEYLVRHRDEVYPEHILNQTESIQSSSNVNDKEDSNKDSSVGKWLITLVVIFILVGVFAGSPSESETKREQKQKVSNTPVSDKYANFKRDKERIKAEAVFSNVSGKFTGHSDIEMLMLNGHPKVLDSTERGYAFFRDIGTKKFYFQMLGDVDLFGDSSSKHILRLEGKKSAVNFENGTAFSKEKVTYITGATLWFYQTNSKVDYETAIKVTDTYVPKDILRNCYVLSYSNKYVSTKKSSPLYEMLYSLDEKKVSQNDEFSLGLPKHLRIYINSNLDNSILYSSVNCSNYSDEERHVQQICNKGYRITKWDYNPLR